MATAPAPSIDELVATDPALLDDESVRAQLRALEVSRAQLDAAELAAVRQLDSRQVWADDGAPNPAGWLSHHTGVARAVAGSTCRLARLLPHMPLTAAALHEGSITGCHVRVLSRCVGPRTAELFAADEEMLVDKARRLTADDLAKVVAYWLTHADTDGPEPGSGGDDQAHMSRTYRNRWRLDADFGPHTGTEVNAALRTKYDELWRADRAAGEADPSDPVAHRTPSQRLAAALVELLGLGAAADDRLTDRRRPAYTALVDLPALHATPGPHSVHETDDGTVIGLADLERDLCDCSIGRVVMAGHSSPVDLGTLTPTPSAAQRRALIARDRGCVVPGCPRPPAWCDAHHIVWRRHGGRTDLGNMGLVCRHHHGRIHGGHLTIEMADGLPMVRRRAGTAIPDPRGSPHP